MYIAKELAAKQMVMGHVTCRDMANIYWVGQLDPVVKQVYHEWGNYIKY